MGTSPVFVTCITHKNHTEGKALLSNYGFKLLILKIFKLFNSYDWPRENFSLQYQFDINQNLEKYKLGDYWLIQHQILWTKIIRII